MHAMWVKVKTDYLSTNPPDFLTHYNYVEFMKLLSEGISLNTKSKITKKFSNRDNKLNKKLNLIKLTFENLNQEYKTIQKEPEFAEVCISWISVKSYYMLFNLLMIVRYLITQDSSSFTCSHSELNKWFVNSIENEDFFFNKKRMNMVFDYSNIIKYKIPAGANIKNLININERNIQIIKKLKQYKEEDFMVQNNIKNLRKKKDKLLIQSLRSNLKVNLFEFFYWYRIKANYRDMEFLSKNVPANKFKEFYDNYYLLTQNFYLAFKNLVNDLSKVRFGCTLLS